MSRPTKPAPIHFVDVSRLGTELRPVCGAWHDLVTWTTLREAMTCPACARLLRIPHPELSEQQPGACDVEAR